MLTAFLERSAQRDPDKVALVCGNRRVTYRELDETADRLAVGLRALNVKRGDRVAIYLENSVEAVVSFFGALKAGAAFVPLGRTVKTDKLAHILNDCEPAAIIADQRALDIVNDALKRSPRVGAAVVVGGSAGVDRRDGLTVVGFEEHVAAQSAAARAAIDPGIDLDLAALVYTSGSSGRPKGVTLTHANMLAATASINRYLEHTPEDVILNVLPLSFDYGLYQVLLAFSSGARVIVERTFGYPLVLLDLVARERVTGLPIVPTLAALLVRHDLAAYASSHLRYITNTGAALPPAHIQQLRKQLPNVKIFSMYGLTECKRVSYLPPDQLETRITSVGKPMDNVEVFVADSEGRLRETGVGELVIRGSNVMQGYWNAPDETARVLKPGKFTGQRLLYSGDEFRIDDEGFMYFQGRLDDVIKSRGQRVSPKEVENVLYELDGVTGAAVVGIHDDVLGAAVKAFLTIDTGVVMTEAEVLRHCAQRLEDFMVPKTVEFVASLPKTESGKIMRRSLESSASAGAPGQAQ